MYDKEIFVKDYFKIHNCYSNIYGKDKTIILMQVGSFHEAYCNDNNGLDLVTLSQKLDVVCTKKNGNKELSDSNPRMMGFPIHVTHNFIEKLINLNFTVVLIDQTSEPPEPKREITGIYSPATYLEKNNSKNCNLVSIVIDKTKTKTSDQLCIGLSSYDLATGNGYIFETYSNSNDQLFALDEALRFLEVVKPREVLLINKITEPIANMKPNELIQYLQIDEKIIYSMQIGNQEKIKYQERILESIFPSDNSLSIFENLNLTFYNLSRLSLVILLEYCTCHQSFILNKLKKPVNFTSDKFLYYGNKSLEQLDVFVKNVGEKGLFNVINYTKSSLGNRYLFNSLCKPLINKEELESRYKSIEIILSNSHENNLEKFLEDIYDIERLHRRIDMGNLHPYELNQMYVSFYQIEKLLNYLESKKLHILHDNSFINLIKNITKFTEYIDKFFKLEMLESTNFNNYFEDNKTFYKKGIYKDIDDLVDKIDSGSNFISLLKDELEKLIGDDKSLFSKKDCSLINNKYNERDGNYMLITNRRCKILKSKLSILKEINVGSYKLKVLDLEFSELPKSSNTKINCNKIKEISNEMSINKQKLANLNKSKFKELLTEISNKFTDLFIYWSKEIGYLDFINSGAICSIKNKYIKPIIHESENSFFDASKLRHPIIEALNKDYNYIPHDIGLGIKNLNGILLYGINSSGKSTLMKSIGLNIILAQIGYYVSAEKFTFWPYKSLFTRIIGNDNMFKGLSSFMVETMELTAILKRNNNFTLVIGDEICKGTEEKSANIIVAYMLETLAKSNSSFITATHLHKVANLDCVKKLTTVKPMHLKITYDPENERLIYDRYLSEGQGESFYGLTVAKFLMKDKSFNERVGEILKEYDDFDNPKKSNYNDDFMIECHICKSKKNLESHHIIPQKDFDKNNTHNKQIHIKKDNYSNIVTLCDKCHDKIDTSEIIINGWVETSSGKILDYKKSDKVKKISHSIELIEYISNLKNTNNYKLSIIMIKEKFNKKVTKNTIDKYWKMKV
jgi:DNA mismatch repair protein MutS